MGYFNSNLEICRQGVGVRDMRANTEFMLIDCDHSYSLGKHSIA